MATTLEFRFPWGRYHATPWGRHVNEGAIDWPPAPWRILRALYATWKTRLPGLDEGLVHAVLDSLAQPPEYVLPPYAESHTRHYMPDTEHRPDVSPSTDKAIDAFAVFPRDDSVVVRWAAELDADQREVLGLLVSRVPYLGRAESLCAGRLLADEEVPEGRWLGPRAGGTTGPATRLLVPDRPLDVEALTVRTTDVRGQRRLDPPGTHWVRYEAAEPSAAARWSPSPPSMEADAAVWALSAPALPSSLAAVAIGDALRQAAMSWYGRLHDGGASPTLSGKSPDGAPLSDHLHAHYLALDLDGDRLLDHVLVWAPGGFDAADIAALSEVPELARLGFVSDFRACRLGLEALGAVEQVAPEVCGPSRAWESFTPFAPARHGKRRVPWGEHVREEVYRELGYRGIPAPVEVTLLRGSWLAFRRHRPVKEQLRDARRATGVRIEFDEPVRGPIVLGALSHFGLGVFLPKQ